MINCIYIHIPFCEKKCSYCAFCSFELLKYKKEYIEALKKEINFHHNKKTSISSLIRKKPLKTIYFGGGTPSLLEVEEIKDILSCFVYDETTQITLEINPNSLTYDKLLGYRDLGINRLSLGVQSFKDEDLKNIGRLHTSRQSIEAIEEIKKAGFDNFSIDLMYGLPEQTLEGWEENLKTALEFDIPHISLYGLKIEEGTHFAHNPPKNLPTQDLQADMQLLSYDILDKKYLHYEFSNFAKDENYKSLHSLAYWTRENYWGFGLSASGFISHARYCNTRNFKDYIKNPTYHKTEIIPFRLQIEEEMFLGLRLAEGVDFNRLSKKYNIDIEKMFKKQIEKFLPTEFMEKTPNGIRLTKKGVLVSNEILCEFISV